MALILLHTLILVRLDFVIRVNCVACETAAVTATHFIINKLNGRNIKLTLFWPSHTLYHSQR